MTYFLCHMITIYFHTLSPIRLYSLFDFLLNYLVFKYCLL